MYECKSCGWSGSEARMVKTAAGWEYAVCPECQCNELRYEENRDIYNEVIEQAKNIRCTCRIHLVYKGKLYEVDKNFDPPKVKEIRNEKTKKRSSSI